MKNTMIAQFNKMNNEFITLMQKVDMSWLNHDNYLYVEVEIDPDYEKIVGDYENFEVKKLIDLPREITEHEMDHLAREKIVGKYPIEKQLNILAQTLEIISDRMGINNDELKEMNSYIDEVRRVNNVRKDFFERSDEFEYISSEEIERRLNKKYEGAISGYTNEIRGL